MPEAVHPNKSTNSQGTMSRTISIILGFIAIAIAVAIAGGISNEIAREAARSMTKSEELSPKQISRVLEESLAIAAQQINEAGPVMLDANTRMDRASPGPGARISYHHTILGHSFLEIDRDQFHHALHGSIRANVCTSPDMAIALQHGATFAYVYADEDQVPITLVEVRQEDCN